MIPGRFHKIPVVIQANHSREQTAIVRSPAQNLEHGGLAIGRDKNGGRTNPAAAPSVHFALSIAAFAAS